MNECRSVRPLLETFVDGELPTEQTLTVQAHLDDCPRCEEHSLFLHSLKNSLRQSVEDSTVVSDAFVARLRGAVRAEVERETSRQATARPWAWRSVPPMVAAAAGLTVWLLNQGHPRNSAPEATSPRAASSATPNKASTGGFEHALDRLIDYHSSPPNPQVTSPELLPSFEPTVGVRLKLPSLAEYGARWEGASLVPVTNHQAAYLRYQMPGHRVTVYVYDAGKVRVHNQLERRIIREHPVYVGSWRGYTVAAKESRGIGYAMTADLDDQQLARMLTALH